MATYWLKDVQVSLAEGAGYTDITNMTGRYYEPVYGYVDMSIGNTIHINDVDGWHTAFDQRIQFSVAPIEEQGFGWKTKG